MDFVREFIFETDIRLACGVWLSFFYASLEPLVVVLFCVVVRITDLNR